jgi:hypothetical protein
MIPAIVTLVLMFSGLLPLLLLSKPVTKTRRLLQACSAIEGIIDLYLYARRAQLIPNNKIIGFMVKCMMKNIMEENKIALPIPYLLYNLPINIPLNINSSTTGAAITE